MKKLVFSLLSIGLAGTLLADESTAAKECPLAAAKDKACTEAKASEFTKVSFKVSNVGCEESCSQLTKTIIGLKGVKGQAVCAKSQTASIEYMEGETCSKTLHASLIKAGYKIEGQQVSLKVKEVHCEVGAAELKGTLTKLKGVQSGDVCHVSGTANVLIDPTKTDSKQLTTLLAKAGYTVTK